MNDRGGERIEPMYTMRVARARSLRACAPTYTPTYTHTYGHTCLRTEWRGASEPSEGSFSGIMPWAFGRRNEHGYRAPLILSNGNHPEITPGKSAFIVSQLNVPLPLATSNSSVPNWIYIHRWIIRHYEG